MRCEATHRSGAICDREVGHRPPHKSHETTGAILKTWKDATAATAPNDSPSRSTASTSAGPQTPAPATSVVRPQTEKLKALGLAMCGKGRLFSAKGSCKCCGASFLAAVTPETCERHTNPLPCAKCDKATREKSRRALAKEAAADALRQKNADASEARAARRAGLGLQQLALV